LRVILKNFTPRKPLSISAYAPVDNGFLGVKIHELFYIIVVWFPLAQPRSRSTVYTARTELWEMGTRLNGREIVKQTELSTFFDRDYLRRFITNWGRKYVLKQ
jgi:hypothetical protein